MAEQLNRIHEGRTVPPLGQQPAEAHVNLDLALIDRLPHADYTIIQPGGWVGRKQECLSPTARKMKIAFGNSYQMDVNVYGASALVVGRWHASGTNGPDSIDYSARFPSFRIKEGGRRRQRLASQSTEIVNNKETQP